MKFYEGGIELINANVIATDIHKHNNEKHEYGGMDHYKIIIFRKRQAGKKINIFIPFFCLLLYYICTFFYYISGYSLYRRSDTTRIIPTENIICKM